MSAVWKYRSNVTVTDVLAVARRNLGIVEGKGNVTPYAGLAGHAQGQPWCATFLVACARRAGLKLGNESAYTPALYASLPHVDRSEVQPGDLMFLYFPSLGRIAHVGIVESVGKSYVITIEGNTDEAGGRTGGKVMRKKRSFKHLYFARPAYAVEKPKVAPKRVPKDPVLRVGNTGQRVLNVQMAINRAAGRKAVVEDGQYGDGTKRAVARLQAKHGLENDGVVGDATWAMLREHYPAAPARLKIA